jgi:hypothetical protein
MTAEPQWITHNGSPTCPVPAGSDCEARLRSGAEMRDSQPEAWRWEQIGWDGDIVSYRIWPTNPEQIAQAEATLRAAGATVTWPPAPPKLVRLTYEVPQWMTEAPEVGAKYWLAEAALGRADAYTWANEVDDQQWFAAGLCYRTEADAQAHIDARAAAVREAGEKQHD